MSTGATDAELVAAIRGGDPGSWGEVFDRHRDAAWQVAWSVTRDHADAEDVVSATFLRGVEVLDQLRDPARLRPWLLAIARRQALDRVRPDRTHEVASDLGQELADRSSDDPDSPIAGLMRDETVRLVEAAFDGLEPRDRAALELSERQGLTGDDLAETLGVTRDNAYALVHNARSRFELSVSSLLVARSGRADCQELDALLAGWDGRLSPLVRKRIARHVRGCDVCESTKRRWVSPAALLATMPLMTMPTLFAGQARAAALSSVSAPSRAVGSSPGAAGGGVLGVKVAVVAALVVLAVAGAGFVALDGADETVAASTIDRGVEATTEPSSDSSETPAPGAAATSTADGSPATSSPATTETPAPATPSTTSPDAQVLAGRLCAAVAALDELASPGPASASENDVRDYLVGTNELLQAVRVAYGTEAGEDLVSYAAAYQGIIDAGVWDLARLPDDPELSDLRTAVEDRLHRDCPATG
ncbi:MAG: sigma-70 family RNA polymerase sigma factor [Acidimicrobiales bacterium]